MRSKRNLAVLNNLKFVSVIKLKSCCSIWLSRKNPRDTDVMKSLGLGGLCYNKVGGCIAYERLDMSLTGDI